MDWSTPSLDGLLSSIWARLRQGALERRDTWHAAALATVNNGQPALRTVVLRAADPAARTLLFFSDARANKIQQLMQRPRVEWLFYDPADRVQLRAQAKAVVHQDDPVAEATWSAKPDLNYLHYLSPLPPGTGLPAFLPVEDTLAQEQEIAYRNFAVVVTTVDRFDWLGLDETSHRRASFQWDGDHFDPRWMVP
jgi:pyridoxamine 5'-phosphate oxidase